jgi:hypothetical protein
MTEPRYNNQLATLATHIRQLWVHENQAFELKRKGQSSDWGMKKMPKWDGGVDSRGAHHKNVWEEIARFCTVHDLQPELLVKALFYDAVYTPMPNQAHGDYALKKYSRYNDPQTRQEIRTNIRSEFEAQRSYAASRVETYKAYGNKTGDEALRLVALNTTGPLSQLFRYCLLKNMGSLVANDYEDVARRQYMRHPDLYDEIWGNWIPNNLRAIYVKEITDEGRSTQA